MFLRIIEIYLCKAKAYPFQRVELIHDELANRTLIACLNFPYLL